MKKYTTLKLAGTLFGTSVICDMMLVFLTVAFSFLNTSAFSKISPALVVAVDIVNLLLNLFIYIDYLFKKAWEEGYRDPNRVNCGHMKKFMAKGLVAGLMADIPYAVLAVLTVFCGAFHLDRAFMGLIFLYANVTFFSPVGILLNYGLRPLLFLFLIPLPLISAVGYVVGYRRLGFSFRFLYKKNKKPAAGKKA